jgi:hypothetical protein
MIYEMIREMEQSNVLDQRTKGLITNGTKVTLSLAMLAGGLTLTIGGISAVTHYINSIDSAKPVEKKQEPIVEDEDNEETV